MVTAPEHTRSGHMPAHRWWREVLFVGAFYALYTGIRNTFGSAKVQPDVAYSHAVDVIRMERWVGLYHEARIQHWFLRFDHFIRFWNVFYGTFHFVVTAAALIWCYRALPGRYSAARNTLAFTTGFALIGFATFPLMPPRLLDVAGDYGGAQFHQGSYGFVDTLSRVGGLWSFDSGTMQSISNQYAAMPSLHCAWSLWSVFVLWPLIRRPVGRVLLAAYPMATLFCIVVTGNHYWLDGVGGVVTLGAGYLAGSTLARRWHDRMARRAGFTAGPESSSHRLLSVQPDMEPGDPTAPGTAGVSETNGEQGDRVAVTAPQYRPPGP